MRSPSKNHNSTRIYHVPAVEFVRMHKVAQQEVRMTKLPSLSHRSMVEQERLKEELRARRAAHRPAKVEHVASRKNVGR